MSFDSQRYTIRSVTLCCELLARRWREAQLQCHLQQPPFFLLFCKETFPPRDELGVMFAYRCATTWSAILRKASSTPAPLLADVSKNSILNLSASALPSSVGTFLSSAGKSVLFPTRIFCTPVSPCWSSC